MTFDLRDGCAIPHAWVRTADGVDHDLTLRGTPIPVRVDLVLSAIEVAQLMHSHGHFGPWAPDPELEAWRAEMRARRLPSGAVEGA